MGATEGDDDRAVLLRWTGTGGTWRLAGAEDGGVVVELLTCSGDEVMGHLRVSDPTVLDRVRGAQVP